MHVYDFITDEFHYQLKQKARKGNDRFEHVIKEYKTQFFQYLRKCKPDSPTHYLPSSLRKNKSVNEWLTLVCETIQKEEPVAKQIFEEVIDGYFLFLRGKHFLSTLKYQDLLERYNLLFEEDILNLSLFFRGTDLKGIGKKKFYHIPYNTRHKVKNQRFSFSGIPFLYLGASIADIYFEFNQSDLNTHEPYVASFAFHPMDLNQIHSRQPKLFNITNLLFNEVNEQIASLTDPNPKPPLKQKKTLITDLAGCFRKLILSHVCTFPRRENGSAFCEEYVIPQLFTEALRMHQYDGIIFSSTSFSEQKIMYSTPFPNLRFKDNLVWFTTYQEDSLYDENLLDMFEIIVKDMKGFGLSDKVVLEEKIHHKIHHIEQQLSDRLDTIRSAYLRRTLADISQRLELYKDMKINGGLYLNTYAGKLELIYTQNYLVFLENQLS
ncbi:hypothetical protein [Xanthocytophaga flava]|uniref:hypothetical protein n=1 Tax=Xanthocytophaga flava TaxID=3048013 RepID=UPI0028D102B1|nr:hypothetical protein [Xanthocytophaga flavus]MDJ1470772.1 hypothetical protein [Xanthocytophaga flavus]